MYSPCEQPMKKPEERSQQQNLSAYASSKQKKPKNTTPSVSQRTIKTSAGDAGRQYFGKNDGRTQSQRSSLSAQRDVLGHSMMNASPSPYFVQNMNSYIKSQNYYKKFFSKLQIPVILQPSQAPVQPFINAESAAVPLQLSVAKSQGKLFFQNRNSKISHQNNQYIPNEKFQQNDSTLNIQMAILQQPGTNQDQVRAQLEAELSSPKPTATTLQKFDVSSNIIFSQEKFNAQSSTMQKRPQRSRDARPQFKVGSTNIQSQNSLTSPVQIRGASQRQIQQSGGKQISQQFKAQNFIDKDGVKRKGSFKPQEPIGPIVRVEEILNTKLVKLGPETPFKVVPVNQEGKESQFRPEQMSQLINLPRDHLTRSQRLRNGAKDIRGKAVISQTLIEEKKSKNELLAIEDTTKQGNQPVYKTFKSDHCEIPIGTKVLPSEPVSYRGTTSQPRRTSHESRKSIGLSQQSAPKLFGQGSMTSLASSRKYRNISVGSSGTIPPIQLQNQLNQDRRMLTTHQQRPLLTQQVTSTPHQALNAPKQPLNEILKTCIKTSSSIVFPSMHQNPQLIQMRANDNQKMIPSRKHTADRREGGVLQRSRDQHVSSNAVSGGTFDDVETPQTQPKDQREVLSDSRDLDSLTFEYEDQSRPFSQEIRQDGIQNQSITEVKSEDNHMNEFIKEFHDYQHKSVNKMTMADKALLKYNSRPRDSSVMGGQHNLRYEQPESTAARPIAFLPIKPIHPPEKKQLFQSSGDLNANKRQDKIAQIYHQNKINKTNRAYFHINNIRKSLTKRRPEWETYNAIIRKGASPPEISMLPNVHNEQISIIENSQSSPLATKPPSRSSMGLTVQGHERAKNSGKLYTQKHPMTKINSSSNLTNSRGALSKQNSQNIRPNLVTAGHQKRTARQPHVVIKNLIITNANLQNCNVFIQNGGSTSHEYTDQHQNQSNYSNSKTFQQMSLMSHQVQTASFDQASSQIEKQRQKPQWKEGLLVIEPKSKNHNQKKKRGTKNDQIFKEILEDDSQKKLNILNRKRATTAVRNSTVIEYEDEEEPGLNKPYTPDKGGPIIDYCQQSREHISSKQNSNKGGGHANRYQKNINSTKTTTNPPLVANFHQSRLQTPSGNSAVTNLCSSQQLKSTAKVKRKDSDSILTVNSNKVGNQLPHSRKNLVQPAAQNVYGDAVYQVKRGILSPSITSIQPIVFQTNAGNENIRAVQGPPVRMRDLTLKDFTKNKMRAPLGVGHFGQVWLVKYNDTGPENMEDQINALYKKKIRKLSLMQKKSSGVSLPSNVSQSSEDLAGQMCVRSFVPLIAPWSQYALKMIELQQLSKQKQIEHLRNERDILCRLQKERKNDPIASCFPMLYSTFKSAMHVNFLMEPIEGITLYDFQREKVYIQLEHVKYFAAKILLILDYLHQQRIVFRDLKMENIMIEQGTGEIRLVDFGFAKDLSLSCEQGTHDRTFTKCGTPGYTAPEVLLQLEGSNMFNITAGENSTSPTKMLSSKGGRNFQSDLVTSASKGTRILTTQKQTGHGYAYPADVWSWGVLLCELIGGFNPFQGTTVQETFENISRISLNWPRNLDQPSSQMLQAIFQRDAALRPTLQSIKRSSFFADVNWSKMEQTFETPRQEITEIVNEIVKRKQQIDTDDFNEANWEQFDISLEQGTSVKSSPAKNFNNRGKPTLSQIKTIHQALCDF